MKRIMALMVCLLLAVPCAALSQTTYPYFQANSLVGTIPVALFTNASATNVVTTLIGWFQANSSGKAQLKMDVFALTKTPTVSNDDRAAYEEMRPLIEAHPGYFVYIFTATFCSCGCSFGYAMSPYQQATAWINPNDFTPYIVAHELNHALGLQHYHKITCPGTAIDSTCVESDEGGGDISGQTPLSLPAQEQFGWVTLSEPQKLPYNAEYSLYIYPRGSSIVIDYVRKFYVWTYNVFRYAVYKYATLTSGDSRCIDYPGGGSVTVSFSGTVESDAPCPVAQCKPLPNEYKTLSCPPGYKGAITQQRISTCPGPTWEPWATISNTCQKRGKK